MLSQQPLIPFLICLFLGSGLKARQTDSLPHHDDHIMDNISWFRVGTDGIDNKTRYTYYASGKEYQISIFVFSANRKIIERYGMSSGGFPNPYRKNAYLKLKNAAWLPAYNEMYYSKTSAPNNIEGHTSVYAFLMPDADSCVSMAMSAFYERDSLFEQQFVLSFFENGIQEKFFKPTRDNIFDFAGRRVVTDAYFERLGPDNIYCPGQGQMSWTIHKNLENAQRGAAVYAESNKGVKRATVVTTDTLMINFEGMPILAKRVRYRVKSGFFPFKKSTSILQVFYVAAELRGQYISCILSYFDDDAKNGALPPPLNNVIKLE